MAILDPTLGALEIGVLISIGLYGIFIVQIFLYTQTTYKDQLWLRCLVGFVWALETAHTFCICILLYSLTVTNYGEPATIALAPASLDLSAVFSAWIGAVIQAFFAYRVKVVSERWVIPVISWSLSLLRASFGIMIGVVTLKSKTLPHFIDQYEWLVITEFTLCAVIDVLNTVSICYYLINRRSTFNASHKLVDKIVIWSIETGLLTSITVLAMLSCALAMPHNLIYIGILMPYAKLFSNSFMTSLNARQGLRQKNTDIVQSASRNTYTGIYVQPPVFSEQNRTLALELSRIDPENRKTTAARHSPRTLASFEENGGKVAEYQ